jgi:DNA-binding CsgD family transcriptional regulator
MATSDALDRARESYARLAWSDAYVRLAAADRESPLEPEDLERLATAAYLLGRDDDSADGWARAYREHLRQGDPQRAARCALWLASGLLLRGEHARAGAWIARARGLLDGGDRDCAEQGYLLVLLGHQRLFEGDPEAAGTIFGRAAEVGGRFDEPDLPALARLGWGLALLMQGQPAAGVAMFDEVMAAATAGELSPMVAGEAYCAAIEVCQEIFDLRRARQWTAALSRWIAAQPELVTYRGQCQIHRAEIMQLHGAWPDALEEARQAGERFSRPPGHPAAGSAFYRQGELHRLRGQVAKAEEAYRQASRWGREPQPGLALLRLAQGQADAAAAASRRVVEEARDQLARCRVLPAHVEIMLAAGDVRAARGAADELSRIAGEVGEPLLEAVAAHAGGAVLLAEGDVRAALAVLRGAWTAWRALDVPYEGARVRVLLGLACRTLGDHDGAEMELDAARWVFQQLGAVPDLARVEALSGRPPTRAAGGLTAREVEVLRLVAAGKTNRAIAADLVLSEKTVARHLSNIYAKLGLSTRAAATAYAYEHDLV